MRLLVLNLCRFGGHVCSYYLCKYGAPHHQVTFLGIHTESNLPFADPIDGVHIIECIKRSGIRGRHDIKRVFSEETMKRQYDVVYAPYFPGISMLQSVKCSAAILFDIRTGSVSNNRFFRLVCDHVLRWEASRFGHVSIISESPEVAY